LSKRIIIEKPHFKFFYILPGEIDKPYAVKDGNERIMQIPPDRFTEIIKQEGSEAMATAIAIGEKYAIALQEREQQARLNLNNNNH